MITPKSKLKVITKSHKPITYSLEIFSNKKSGVGAEDIMPILVYIYSQAKLKYLLSSTKYYLNKVSYIDLYGRFCIKMKEMDEYCYITVKGLITYFGSHDK